MDVGGRALRGSAFAAVLRSTAHSSLRRSPTIPNAVHRTKVYLTVAKFPLVTVKIFLILSTYLCTFVDKFCINLLSEITIILSTYLCTFVDNYDG